MNKLNMIKRNIEILFIISHIPELFKVKETMFQHWFENCTTIYIMKIIGSAQNKA